MKGRKPPVLAHGALESLHGGLRQGEAHLQGPGEMEGGCLQGSHGLELHKESLGPN